ncbi:demethylmenaquinone methyltransferase / 2-methoxy-6-polyprenyl-1,4-benzoquinol methylase [Anaerolineales bacterium]|nr:demethylmenaquinone methyltransferase / 2-methoxy-6-polyprenyl-1,4-benzoquinol methylase [Anaerolineales bacterium]
MGVEAKKKMRQGSWYQRVVAHVIATDVANYNAMVRDRKQALISGLHGKIVEFGMRAGANLSFFAPDVQWLGVDPNPAMFPYVEQEAQRLGMAVEIHEGKAESLPVESDSVDAVVCTTVLCTVRDPRQSLQEVLRVLKPGGRFVFIEHVAAPRRTWLRRQQNLVHFVWRLYADGCCPNRETWALIENAGFSQVKIEHFRLKLGFLGPHIAGFAVK